MPSLELHVFRGGSLLCRVPVPVEGLVLGRSHEAKACLTGESVSRRHAKVTLDQDGVLVEDLGSRNGVYVDGARVARAHVECGESFQIGDYALFVKRPGALSDSASVISFENASALYDKMVTEHDPQRIPVLYRAAQLLGSVFDIDELLEQTLRLVFEAVPARRGFVILTSPGAQHPEVHARFPEDGDDSDLPLSNTLIDHVLSNRDAVLTFDAQEDTRFADADSIVLHAIRCAMCVPLWGRFGLVGAVYVDSGQASGVFSEADLEMLTAIGRVTGVAVENARLYKDNIEKERLSAIGLAMTSVAHCVKNILTTMRGGAQFVDEALGSGDLDPLRIGWPMLRRSVDRVERLMMDLLTVSKERTPQRMPVDLNGVIEEVIAEVAPEAERRGVPLRFVRAPLPAASVDKRDVYRSVLNLVLNAVDACEGTKAPVEVRCAFLDGRHAIEVRDEGPGIAPEIRAKLFEPFVSNKGSRGTGLGLACVKKIAEEHGGTVHVETSPGAGTAFTIFLPVQEEPSA